VDVPDTEISNETFAETHESRPPFHAVYFEARSERARDDAELSRAAADIEDPPYSTSPESRRYAFSDRHRSPVVAGPLTFVAREHFVERFVVEK
jgi:hypothetical protein